MSLSIDTKASLFVDVIRKDGKAVGSIQRGHDTETETTPDLYFAGVGEGAQLCARVWPEGKAPAWIDDTDSKLCHLLPPLQHLDATEGEALGIVSVGGFDPDSL